MHQRFIRRAVLVAGALVASLLISGPAGASSAGARGAGQVYVLSNQAASNEVLVYDRLSDGTLAFAEAVPTGGHGSGTGTGSQGALALSDDGAWLLAVDPGSDTVSSLAVDPDGLHPVDTVPSGGDLPTSVAISGNLVYVLNAGGGNNVSGFHISDEGTLTPIPNSTMVLSGGGVAPAQVGFDPTGSVLVVTEKATNLIDTYRVADDGHVTGPRTTPSSGQTPFGFLFDPAGHLIVSEAFGGAPDASAVSSYLSNGRGRLTVITPSLHDTETAACWIAITEDGAFTYTTNTGSGSVSGYAIDGDGNLTLLDPDGVTAFTGRRSAPIDEDVSNGSSYLYVNLSGTHEVAGFAIGADGDLTPVDQVSGLPSGAVGLIAT